MYAAGTTMTLLPPAASAITFVALTLFVAPANVVEHMATDVGAPCRAGASDGAKAVTWK